MSRIVASHSITTEITITFTEDESKALEHLCKYSDGDILRALSALSLTLAETQGIALMSVFDGVRTHIKPALEDLSQARSFLREQKKMRSSKNEQRT